MTAAIGGFVIGVFAGGVLCTVLVLVGSDWRRHG